jgi:hypothetical protein
MLTGPALVDNSIIKQGRHAIQVFHVAVDYSWFTFFEDIMGTHVAQASLPSRKRCPFISQLLPRGRIWPKFSPEAKVSQISPSFGRWEILVIIALNEV